MAGSRQCGSIGDSYHLRYSVSALVLTRLSTAATVAISDPPAPGHFSDLSVDALRPRALTGILHLDRQRTYALDREIHRLAILHPTNPLMICAGGDEVAG